MARFLALAIFILAVSSCGGGGGGSGSGSGSSSARTGIRVLHGAIDLGPVELKIIDGQLLQSSAFADSTFYSGLSTGNSSLRLSPRLADSTHLYSSTVSVEKDQHYSLLIYGDQEVLGLRTTLLSDASVADEIDSGASRLRIVHAVIGASSISGSAGPTTLEPTQFGRGSTYANVPAGPATIILRRVADGNAILNFSTTLEAGTAYTIFVTGEIDYFVTSKLLIDN